MKIFNLILIIFSSIGENALKDNFVSIKEIIEKMRRITAKDRPNCSEILDHQDEWLNSRNITWPNFVFNDLPECLSLIIYIKHSNNFNSI